MRKKPFSLAVVVAAALCLGQPAALAAAAVPAQPAVSALRVAAACEISDATMTWGVRESFRSYISGSIANGSWEATDGASYETPNFIFSGGSGTAEQGQAEVNFKGKIHFTGHEGVLDLTLANPKVELLSARSNP